MQRPSTWLTCCCSRWQPKEAQIYLAWVQKLAQERADQGWMLDLSWLNELKELKVAVPVALQPLCRQ